jgi:hypothetical protein
MGFAGTITRLRNKPYIGTSSGCCLTRNDSSGPWASEPARQATGSPQWQIEASRRVEIPEDMQQKHGFKPLGGPLDAAKTAIFSGSNARLYNIDVKKAERSLGNDQFAALKRD